MTHGMGMRQARDSCTMLLAPLLAAFALAGCAQAPQGVAAEPGAAGPSAFFATCQRPVYPPQALARKAEGTSSIQLLVGPDAHVRDM